MKSKTYRLINGSISYKEDILRKNKKSIKINFLENNKNLKKKMILTAGPSVSSKELVYTLDAALNGWNENMNYYLDKLAKSFSNLIGVKYALPTSSCTGALHIALLALGIKSGDEVIVPNITWVATASVVKFVGATPVFADVGLDDWNICPKQVEKLITKRTKAIIVVHLYGHPANMYSIKKIVKKHNLKLLEDAAPAIGAEFNKKKCGSFGDFAAFSFQGAKLVVCGEGGILLTNNYNYYKKAKKIWNFGRTTKDSLDGTFWIDSHGMKYKMSNLQAAFALGQLERVKELVKKKREIFNLYKTKLKNLLKNKIALNEELPNRRSIYWMTSLRILNYKKNKRKNLIDFLKKNNIDTRPVFPPINQYPIWKNKNKTTKNADILSKSAINLPSGVNLSKEEIIYICKIINKFFIKND